MTELLLLAEIFRFTIGPLEWAILERINLGPLAVSPHGIGIALGYLAGAQLMVKRSRTRGGPDETDIWNALFWALLGAIVGARVGYVLGHFSEVTSGGDDLLGIFRIWEGGISLLGGITGAVLIALPYMFKRKMGFWRTMDLAAPGLALGIVIGRLGDLVIGDHIGTPTNFPLGWRCLGNGGEPPLPAEMYLDRFEAGSPPALGCFDLTLHQTAIYDFISTLFLLGALLYLGRKARNPGFMILVFTIWYGAMRVITDFLRVDRRYLGLTGSQITSILVGLACIYLLSRYRGAPPRWQRAPAGPPEAIVATSEEGEAQPEGALPLRGAEDGEQPEPAEVAPAATQSEQEDPDTPS
jgi:phosphatidylglycerol:prolipoprotein diacylglycerol transferase